PVVAAHPPGPGLYRHQRRLPVGRLATDRRRSGGPADVRRRLSRVLHLPVQRGDDAEATVADVVGGLVLERLVLPQLAQDVADDQAGRLVQAVTLHARGQVTNGVRVLQRIGLGLGQVAQGDHALADVLPAG